LNTARFSTGVMHPGTPTTTRGRSRQPGRCAFAEEIAEHRLAQLEIANHAALQRANHRNRFRRAAFHLLGEVSDRAAAGENPARAVLQGNDRRLVEHQPFADHADERVGRSQINGQVVAESA